MGEVACFCIKPRKILKSIMQKLSVKVFKNMHKTATEHCETGLCILVPTNFENDTKTLNAKLCKSVKLSSVFKFHCATVPCIFKP